jgi:5-methylcytosine-specific restriction endonuclease McrA
MHGESTTTPTRRNRPSWGAPWWAATRARVFIRDRFTCQHCGWTPAWIPVGYDGYQRLPCVRFPILTMLELDHIHPFSKSGAHEDDNLQTLCNRCNARKATQVPEGT